MQEESSLSCLSLTGSIGHDSGLSFGKNVRHTR
jgi:hypothetical protein